MYIETKKKIGTLTREDVEELINKRLMTMLINEDSSKIIELFVVNSDSFLFCA